MNGWALKKEEESVDKRRVYGTPLILISLLAMLFIPLFSQNIADPEEVTWTRNSSCLDAFLADPVANLSCLERMDDLYYWTLVYGNIKGIPFMMRELFSKKLLASDVDEAKLDAIFRILKACSSPLSYEWIRPIISRIFEIASNRPGWFARNLLSRDDWKATLRSIVKGDLARFIGKRGGLKDIISNLEDGEDKKKLMDAIKDIENEERMDSEKLSEFFKDPSKGLEGIEGIYDLCHMMGPIHLDNRFDILISWLTKEPDKKKATILFHFMNHCDGAYHMELMADLAMDFFLGHMPLVVSALKENKNWRWIVLFVSHWLREEDGEFKSTISNLGNTEFEMKIRAQLEFLRDHFSY